MCDLDYRLIHGVYISSVNMLKFWLDLYYVSYMYSCRSCLLTYYLLLIPGCVILYVSLMHVCYTIDFMHVCYTTDFMHVSIQVSH